MLTIVDYGCGNLGSIVNMFKKIGVECRVSGEPKEILSATSLILPGVGAFDHGMHELTRRGLIETLNKKVLDGNTPLLGICLGAQLICRGSEEGVSKGLGWIDADVICFDKSKLGPNDKIPNMGWHDVNPLLSHPLFFGLEKESRFYFVHSFHICCDNNLDVLATARHGACYNAAVSRGNIMGVQFHPEKSHKFGLKLLTNFASNYG